MAWRTSHKLAGACRRAEPAFIVDDDCEVERRYEAWNALGMSFAQPPTAAVSGPALVALAPDGHRLPACTPDD
ncbi:hypothetical protein BFF94_011955 [Burkholderia catarinensis]|nr:hypothetical protein BFF94_011955 [Burkholderia catarinensis]